MPEASSTPIDRVTVGDCMHYGIYGCDPEASLVEVAAIMSDRHTHCVVLPNGSGQTVISDLDVISAIGRDVNLRARDIAAGEPVKVSSDASLRQAAQLMTEHAVAHVVVLDRADGHLVGVLSSTDIISAYASRGGYGATA